MKRMRKMAAVVAIFATAALMTSCGTVVKVPEEENPDPSTQQNPWEISPPQVGGTSPMPTDMPEYDGGSYYDYWGDGGGGWSDGDWNGGGNADDGSGNGDGGNGNGNGGGNGNGNDDGGGVVPFNDHDGDGIADEEDSDADNDGFFAWDGDCDDLNENTYPGAPDEPDHPDYTDSNCDGIDGDLARAVWVAPNGDDSGPGTIDRPFQTLKVAIDKAKANLENIKDVYAAEGDYSEDAVLDGGVGLFGGFGQLDNEGLRERKIAVYVMKYRSQSEPFVVGPAISAKESVVEGVTFIGARDNVAMIVVNSSPTIRYNEILGANSPLYSMAMTVLAIGEQVASRPFIHDNHIESGQGGRKGSYSIAVTVGAFGVGTEAEPLFKKNAITSGDAGYASLGIYAMEDAGGSASFVASENTIAAASAEAYTAGIFTGWDVFEGGIRGFTRARIHRNMIYGGRDSGGSTGIVLLSGTSMSEIWNNFVTGGDRNVSYSHGIHVNNSAASIYNNTVNGGSATFFTVGIMLQDKARTKIDNNILFAKSTDMAPAFNRIGIYEADVSATPDSLRNNLFIDLESKYQDLLFGILTTIDEVNAMADIAVDMDNIDGDAIFKDIDARDYHLMPGSDAIDAGLELADVPNDIDGDMRPQGEASDIGADETFLDRPEPDDDDADDNDDDMDQGEEDEHDECEDGCDDDEDGHDDADNDGFFVD